MTDRLTKAREKLRVELKWAHDEPWRAAIAVEELISAKLASPPATDAGQGRSTPTDAATGSGNAAASVKSGVVPSRGDSGRNRG